MLTKLQIAQVKFAQDTAKLVQYAKSRGIPCFPHELGLLQQRKIILPDGRTAKGRDNVHKLNGNHYRFLAFDLIVFSKSGQRLVTGLEPEWEILGKYWESLDASNDNGRHWGDANHFSRTWEGMK